MINLTLDAQFLLWGALIKVLYYHNRLSEQTAQIFDWPEWSWELREDECDALERFVRAIEPTRTQ